MAVKIKSIDVEETYPLRISVLKTCESYEYKYKGDFDSETIHFGVFKENKLIGIASLMTSKNLLFDDNQLQIRGMAINDNMHNKGIGSLLIKHIIDYSLKENISTVWCNARVTARNFYKKQGFVISGKPFHIKNVGMHNIMYKKIL